eukprot:388402_1
MAFASIVIGLFLPLHLHGLKWRQQQLLRLEQERERERQRNQREEQERAAAPEGPKAHSGQGRYWAPKHHSGEGPYRAPEGPYDQDYFPNDRKFQNECRPYDRYPYQNRKFQNECRPCDRYPYHNHNYRNESRPYDRHCKKPRRFHVGNNKNTHKIYQQTIETKAFRDKPMKPWRCNNGNDCPHGNDCIYA